MKMVLDSPEWLFGHEKEKEEEKEGVDPLLVPCDESASYFSENLRLLNLAESFAITSTREEENFYDRLPS